MWSGAVSINYSQLVLTEVKCLLVFNEVIIGDVDLAADGPLHGNPHLYQSHRLATSLSVHIRGK